MSKRNTNEDEPVTEEAPQESEAVLIDALHEHGSEPRLKPGSRSRVTVIARDPKTHEPTVVIHRPTGAPVDATVTVGEYIEGDSGKYRCTIAKDTEAE